MTKPTHNAQSLLSSVVSIGKTSVRSVGAVEIEQLIRTQPEITGPVSITNVRSNAEMGASNGTVLFTAEYDAGAGRITRNLVLRHAPGSETRLFFEYDLSRQFRVQRALQGSGVPVPEPLWLDADGAVLGVPGFIMSFVSGEAPFTAAFTKGPLARANDTDRQSMIESVMKCLVGIHQLDYAARGLDDFVMNAPGDSPMQKCVNWYWQTWEWINIPAYSRMESVRRWLLDNAPSGGVTLMHGDAMLHNYLFADNKVVSVLDWEMSSLARPEADLALQCIENELFAAPPGSGLPIAPSQEEWLALYQKAGGGPLEHFDYFKKYAVYMVSVSVQALQRNLPEEARAAQRPFTDRCWEILES